VPIILSRIGLENDIENWPRGGNGVTGLTVDYLAATGMFIVTCSWAWEPAAMTLDGHTNK
jgi:hypothetical protein